MTYSGPWSIVSVNEVFYTEVNTLILAFILMAMQRHNRSNFSLPSLLHFVLNSFCIGEWLQSAFLCVLFVTIYLLVLYLYLLCVKKCLLNNWSNSMQQFATMWSMFCAFHCDCSLNLSLSLTPWGSLTNPVLNHHQLCEIVTILEPWPLCMVIGSS